MHCRVSGKCNICILSFLLNITKPRELCVFFNFISAHSGYKATGFIHFWSIVSWTLGIFPLHFHPCLPFVSHWSSSSSFKAQTSSLPCKFSLKALVSEAGPKEPASKAELAAAPQACSRDQPLDLCWVFGKHCCCYCVAFVVPLFKRTWSHLNLLHHVPWRIISTHFSINSKTQILNKKSCTISKTLPWIRCCSKLHIKT